MYDLETWITGVFNLPLFALCVCVSGVCVLSDVDLPLSPVLIEADT